MLFEEKISQSSLNVNNVSNYLYLPTVYLPPKPIISAINNKSIFSRGTSHFLNNSIAATALPPVAIISSNIKNFLSGLTKFL